MKSPPLLYYPDFYPDAAWLRAVLLLNDEVCRIVPNDVQLDDPESLRQIEGELGALTKISPEYVHTNPYSTAAEWLDRTFLLISRELRAGKDSRRLQISISGGQTNYHGNVLVYDQKLSRRMREMLVEHDLVDPTLQELVAELHGDVKGLMIPAAAANAVLSFIADTIAREKGFTAITNQPLEFAMNTLLGLNIPVRPPSGAHEGILAGVYASVLIPKEIGEIPFSDYKILRERSADVRAAFARFVQDCSRTGGLQGIESTTTLQRRIERSGRELEREFNKFQTSGGKALRFVKQWWPFTVGGVLAIAKDVVPPQWALTFGVAAQIAKFAHQATLPPADRTKETVFNLAAKLGTDIRDLPRIPELMAAR
jgi:hypothetical protein